MTRTVSKTPTPRPGLPAGTFIASSTRATARAPGTGSDLRAAIAEVHPARRYAHRRG